MASGVEELLDILFEMIDEAKGVPLSSDKCMIERDRALDLLDDIRAQFPMELREAKKLLAARAEYIASATREAELIKKQAEEEAHRILDGNELVQQARQKSADMIRVAEERCRDLQRVAEERCRDLRRAANEYCEDALHRTEEAVAEAHEEIKQSRIRFRMAAGAEQQEEAPKAEPNVRNFYDAEADGGI